MPRVGRRRLTWRRATGEAFFAARKPIGAICHGVLFAARCQQYGRSVLDGYHTTALTEQMEMLAWILTEKWVGDYYRTYPETVQREVTRAVGPTGQFLPEPRGLNPARAPDVVGLIGAAAAWVMDLCRNSFLRDSPGDSEPAYIAEHGGHYVSARWPGDAFAFGRRFLAILRAAPAPAA
jgi:protease I